jgi:hypothetical protein
MFGKTSLLFIILHVFIITYLIVTVIGVSENVMLILHIIAPFVVVSTLYLIIKTFGYSQSSIVKSQTEDHKAF